MEKDVFAVLVCLILAVIMFIAYLFAKKHEYSYTPRYMNEVYYREGAGSTADIYLAIPATAEQIAGYVKAGGESPTTPMLPMYGPKPRPGTKGVLPFNASRWFE
jgi:hypothetical protein